MKRAKDRLRAIVRRTSRRLPLPPLELRQMVGPTDEADYDNADGAPVYEGIDEGAYEAVFDFGCGCGRFARQLMQQHPLPRSRR